MTRLIPFALALLVLAAGPSPLSGQQPAVRVPAAQVAGEWLVEGAARAGDVKIDTFLGRPALWLRAGTQAIKAGARFVDGTIEFDVAPMDRGDFVAAVFRRGSLTNHENIYLRPRSSGEFMAIQYAPRMNGSSTWQLYPEFTAKTDWPRNAWTHVRIEVRGSTMEIFVGGASKPTVVVPRLRHPSADADEVAFWARVNDRPTEWAAALSNIDIRPAAPAVRVEAPAPPAGVVARWEVAAPVKAAGARVTALPSNLTWISAAAEESGLLNLNARFTAQPQQGRFTVFARTTIDAAAPRRQLAGIGYSDDVTVFVNGEPVYVGVNGWDTRTPELVSFVNPRFEQVWLPLRAGRNEVVLAVTDDQRFGWGLAMTLDESDAE
jgi:hypothetical protein